MSNATYREIMNQPEAWIAAIEVVESKLASLKGYWHREQCKPVIFSGCGSPYYLAQSVATTFRGRLGCPAEAYPASNIWLFPESHIRDEHSLLVCISRSGKTTEIVKAAETFRAKTGGDVLTITCYEDTALSKVSSETLVLAAAKEESLAQTQSFTSMLIAAQYLIDIFSDQTSVNNLKKLADECQSQLATYNELAKKIGETLSYERFFFLGSGTLFGIASEGTLKLKEMTISYAEAFHFLEFRHGPMALVDENTLVIGLVSSVTAPHEQVVLREMRQMGADVLAVSPFQLPEDTYDYQVLLPDGFTDDERAALYLPVLQLIAQYRAVARGLNPDSPDNLNAFVNLDLRYLDGQ